MESQPPLHGSSQSEEPRSADINLLDLFFRPRHFYGQLDRLFHQGFILAAAWMFAIHQTLDRVLRDAPLNNWGIVWLIAIGAGALSGFIVWFIGGWWFNKRIEWSGAIHQKKDLGREVYLYSTVVISLPNLIYMASNSFIYETPSGYLSAYLWSDLIMSLFVFWSMWTAYTGVVTIFPVRLRKAFLWFVVLPSAWYGLGLVTIVLLLLGAHS